MTIREVAELAGVSSAAVSRYLNNGSLSTKKRERIREVIEKTGYKPSAAGIMLRTGRINQIGVIVSRISSEAVGELTDGVSGKLAGSSYMVMFGNCNESEKAALNYLSLMQKNHVAGIILMGTTYNEAFQKAFRDCSVPLVVTGQNFPGVSCVYHDDFGAARELTARMIAHGHRRIGYIGVTEKDPAVGIERQKGVRQALNDAGLDGENMPSVRGRFDRESGAAGVMKLIAMDPGIDGVICATDSIALGAMEKLKQLGRFIPADTGIAGFGDHWSDTITVPPLTSVRLQQKQCGEEAAAMILDIIAGGQGGEPRKLRLGFEIRERESL
jgi:LacI family sucrose operon transcriptional repressor